MSMVSKSLWKRLKCICGFHDFKSVLFVSEKQERRYDKLECRCCGKTEFRLLMPVVYCSRNRAEENADV